MPSRTKNPTPPKKTPTQNKQTKKPKTTKPKNKQKTTEGNPLQIWQDLDKTNSDMF